MSVPTSGVFMRRTARFLTVLLVTVVLTAPTVSAGSNDWMSFQRDALHVAKAEGGDLATPLKLGWKKAIDGEILASPVVAGDSLYIGTMSGKFFALEKDSSRTRWSFDAGTPIRGTATVESDRVYFATYDPTDATKGELIVLRTKDGSIVARKTLDGGSWSGPVVQAGKVFVGTESGSMIAYETEGFSQLWSLTTAQYAIAKGAVRTVPILYENTVFFSAFNQLLFAADAGGKAGTTTTDIKWVEKMGDIVYSSGALDTKTMTGTLFVGSYDGKLYAISKDARSDTETCPTADGRTSHPSLAPCSANVRYRYEAGASIHGSPAIANGRVFFGDQHGKFHSITAWTGAKNWVTEIGSPIRSSPAVVNHTIVFGADDGNLHVLKESNDGLTVVSHTKFEMSGKVHASPAISEGTVYIATQEGLLYSILDANKAKPEIKPDPKPDLGIEKIVLDPEPPVTGQVLTLTVTVKNLGEIQASTVPLRLYQDDELVEETSATLGALATQSYTFEIESFPGVATYRAVIDENATIDDADRTNQEYTVDASDPNDGSSEVPIASPPPVEKKKDGGEDEDIPAPGAVILVALLAVALVALRRRR